MVRIMSAIFALLLIVATYPAPGSAQAVRIENGDGEHGHGLMFNHSGICYVILPRHVAGQDMHPRVNLSTAAPVVHGTGNVLRPFWEGIDLALAVASEAMRPRCTLRLNDIAPKSAVQSASKAHLLRLMPDGSEERFRIDVEDRNYLTFDARVADTESAEIAQGTSGAFAFSEGTPIGMAITSDDPKNATFIQIEEIIMNVRRYVSQSRSQSGPESVNMSLSPSQSFEGRLPIGLVSASVPAISPSLAAENMLGESLFVFMPAKRMVFEFKFETDTNPSISRFRIVSPKDPRYAMPKNVLIEVSTDETGENFKPYLRYTLGPDGVLDTGSFAKRYVRRFRVIVLDAWNDGPIAIDRVSAW